MTPTTLSNVLSWLLRSHFFENLFCWSQGKNEGQRRSFSSFLFNSIFSWCGFPCMHARGFPQNNKFDLLRSNVWIMKDTEEEEKVNWLFGSISCQTKIQETLFFSSKVFTDHIFIRMEEKNKRREQTQSLDRDLFGNPSSVPHFSHKKMAGDDLLHWI